MTILFITGNTAILPEIDAYISFFSRYPGIHTKVVFTTTGHQVQADVEWYFMGMYRRRHNNTITIHEYTSASVPPFVSLKNWLKKKLNCRPDYRLFYSEYVKEQFNFRDSTPFGYRSHGIMDDRDMHTGSDKKYDFIYVGSADKQRELSTLFSSFTTGSMRDKTLLVLSKNYRAVAEALKNYPNIIFKGPVPYAEVYSYIRQSRFAINFIPDKLPYNQQVSAKFIDYAACGAKIISSDYAWVRDFQKKNGGEYFYLSGSLQNFTWHNINDFHYVRPELQHYTWNNQMERSGILDFLQEKFPEMRGVKGV